MYLHVPSSLQRENMKRTLSLFLLFASGAAFADDAAILKCRALGDTASRLNCYDAIHVSMAAMRGSAVPVAAKLPEQRFGMETMPKKPDPEEPKAIESTIVGDFDGWRPGAQIRLANGQVWRVVDDSEAVLNRMSNPKVRIERNLFGTLFLKVEGTNNSAKVRRIQ
jgi:hypothetical protein